MGGAVVKLASVDFLREPSQPVGGWWMFAAGAVSVVCAIAFAHHCRALRDETVLRERAILSAREAGQRPAAAAPPTPAQRRWQQAQPELAKPWKAALRAIESSTHAPIYLLSMNMDPATGLIRLEGEAPSFDLALAYVRALNAESALSSATLEAHEEMSSPGGQSVTAGFSPPVPQVASPANRPIVHFRASARWRSP